MKKFSIIAAILFLICSSANADWYVELTGVDGELTAGDYYTMDINFVTDEPDINFRNFFFTVDYDETLLDFVIYDGLKYDDGGFPAPTTIWHSDLPCNGSSGDYVYNLMGAEVLGEAGTFFPYTMVGPIAKMGTVWFMAKETGTYEDLGEWSDGPVTDVMSIGLNHLYLQAEDSDLEVNKVGSTSQITAIPIPGAIFLLAPAFLGLIGLRRKKA